MSKNNVTVRIGGAAGDGATSTGEIFARTCSRSGLHVFGFQSYPSLIRGGHNWYQVRTGERKALSQGDHLDLLIALNQDSLDRHASHLDEGGGAIYDGNKVKLREEMKEGIHVFPTPLAELAKEHGTHPVMRNMVALGVLIHLLKMKFDSLAGVIRDSFIEKGAKVTEANIGAAQSGYDYAEKIMLRKISLGLSMG